MFLALKRTLAINAPWLFKQTTPSISIRNISSESMQNELKNRLSEGFLYAFNSIVDSYQSQDIDLLSQCLEPRLFKHVSNSFTSLSSQGYKFIKISETSPSLSLANMQLTLGVYVDRTQNLNKNDYYMIKSVEEFKKFIPLDFLKKQLKKDTVNIDENILNSCMDYAYMYILPRAPANLVLAVDAIYNTEPVLTLEKDGKDQVYDGNMNKEIHTLRFESEPVKLGMQKDAIGIGNFDKIFEELKKQKNQFYDNPWIVTDIDNILKGNPYAL
ncbi:hypothetical protein SteCoe_19440 [Stentor coeruleus]|uniref:Uncharacterized protein n=1 Tax=Stentor coeruleus TaxID=5963 RepID=A0A1R2BUH3_9CILI|nr:hypothetical protein SteCoe_19440 [Stentor coeruleus]